MTQSTTESTSVRTTIDVAVPPDRAFEVFTAGIDRWWTRSHHLLPGTLKRVWVEPRVGGAMMEENDAGQTCSWGRVLAFEPPGVFAFSWQIGTDWEVPAPDAPGSRVTVTFEPRDRGTHVVLVHDQLEAHGADWESMRRAVGAERGWPGILQNFAAVL